MNGRNDCHIRPKIAVRTNHNQCIVLNRQVKVAEKAVADFRMHAVMDIHRPLDKAGFAKCAENLLYKSAPLLRFVLKGAVILAA